MDIEQEMALLERMRHGDEASFKKVYEENRTKFLNFARRYELDEDERIDIYQDTYIAFYNNVLSRKLTTLTSSLSTYLFGIGKLMIMKRLKNKQRTVSSDYVLSVATEEAVEMDTLDLDAVYLTPEQELLKTHFATLGEQCQKLLTLFYYRGFSIKEIIEAEGYNNENVVKATKSRCMRTLRERITENKTY